MPFTRLALASAVALALSAEAEAQVAPAASAEPSSTSQSHFVFGVGASDWNGDYGAPTNTNIASTLLTAQYRAGALRLSASLPWMRIDSQGAVYAGVDGTPLVVAPNRQTPRTVRDGVGDLTLGAAYLVPLPPGLGFDVDTFARVKVPTASKDSGVSTGEADYAFGAEISRSYGRLVPFASLRYRVFGDSPALPLRDGVATSVGATYVFGNRLAATASYDFAQSASRFVGDAHELVGSLSAPLGQSGLRLSGYAAAGLSQGAADISGGLSLSVRL